MSNETDRELLVRKPRFRLLELMIDIVASGVDSKPILPVSGATWYMLFRLVFARSGSECRR